MAPWPIRSPDEGHPRHQRVAGPDPGVIEAEVAISAISLAELHFGVLVATSPAVRAERLRRLTIIEKTFDALPVDDSVTREYGRLAAAVVATGRQPKRARQ